MMHVTAHRINEVKTAMADELIDSLIRKTEEEHLIWAESLSMNDEYPVYTLCQDTASGCIQYAVKREESAEADREAFGFRITHDGRDMYTAHMTNLVGYEADNEFRRLYHAADRSFKKALAADEPDIEILQGALEAIHQTQMSEDL